MRVVRTQASRAGGCRFDAPGEWIQKAGLVLALGLALGGFAAEPGAAQDAVAVSGTVADAQGLALPGVTVNVFNMPGRRLVRSTVSRGDGTFVVSGLTPGAYLLSAQLQGFRRQEESIDLPQSRSDLQITLPIGTFEQRVIVTAQMPEVTADVIVPGGQFERAAAQDIAAYLRSEPGVSAVRRGGINLEPTVRGLYEAQMGVFVDGTRTFAAGPARMDSEISHVSPHMLQSLEVVKGPYALTQGSGTLSSLRAQIFRPAFSGTTLRPHGRGSFNVTQNGTAPDGFGGVWASNERVRFALFHNTRIGHDYTSGDGATVQGGYQSYDTRWDIGAQPAPNLRVEYAGGYQDQEGLDYPGRILDATYIKATSHSAEVSWRPRRSMVSEVFGQVYTNLKDHLMNNDEKPTGRPMDGRIPPFALRIDLPTTSNTTGASGYVAWRHDRWEGKLGGDVYRLAQDATRSIYRRDTGVLLFQDIVWPDAKLTNGGAYGQVVYQHGAARIGGTLRGDTFRAAAGDVSDFFLDHTTGELDRHESAISAAVNASLQVRPEWTLTLGVGRAVRAPDTLERYSDRFPAAQFQVAAEFLGNPSLTTEKSLEFNAGSLVQLPRVTVRADVFHRTIDDYITVTPDPSVPKRLPLSPPVVYRYINGAQATFSGFEASATSAVESHVDLRGSYSYLRADDETFNEPVFGIAPFQQRYALEVHTADRSAWAEIGVTVTAAQGRVARQRLEQPTDGRTVLSLRGGLPLAHGVTLRGGVENLADRAYADHLNAPNPFTGARVLERGRSVYVGAEYAF